MIEIIRCSIENEIYGIENDVKWYRKWGKWFKVKGDVIWCIM